MGGLGYCYGKPFFTWTKIVLRKVFDQYKPPLSEYHLPELHTEAVDESLLCMPALDYLSDLDTFRASAEGGQGYQRKCKLCICSLDIFFSHLGNNHRSLSLVKTIGFQVQLKWK